LEYRVDIKSDKIKVEEKDGKYPLNLEDRFLQFSIDVIRFLIKLPKTREFDVIRNQLSKSATSIGANYQESQASSHAEFKQRIQICLRETRETLYWLRLMRELFKDQSVLEEKIQILFREANELKNIFGAIFNKIRKKSLQS
jgi:four helix bundle protein